MEKTGQRLYQVEYKKGVAAVKHRFDIVVGSGTNGQTIYLLVGAAGSFNCRYSILTGRNEWANSPGYPGIVHFQPAHHFPLSRMSQPYFQEDLCA